MDIHFLERDEEEQKVYLNSLSFRDLCLLGFASEDCKNAIKALARRECNKCEWTFTNANWQLFLYPNDEETWGRSVRMTSEELDIPPENAKDFARFIFEIFNVHVCSATVPAMEGVRDLFIFDAWYPKPFAEVEVVPEYENPLSSEGFSNLMADMCTDKLATYEMDRNINFELQTAFYEMIIENSLWLDPAHLKDIGLTKMIIRNVEPMNITDVSPIIEDWYMNGPSRKLDLFVCPFDVDKKLYNQLFTLLLGDIPMTHYDRIRTIFSLLPNGNHPYRVIQRESDGKYAALVFNIVGKQLLIKTWFDVDEMPQNADLDVYSSFWNRSFRLSNVAQEIIFKYFNLATLIYLRLESRYNQKGIYLNAKLRSSRCKWIFVDETEWMFELFPHNDWWERPLSAFSFERGMPLRGLLPFAGRITEMFGIYEHNLQIIARRGIQNYFTQCQWIPPFSTIEVFSPVGRMEQWTGYDLKFVIEQLRPETLITNLMHRDITYDDVVTVNNLIINEFVWLSRTGLKNLNVQQIQIFLQPDNDSVPLRRFDEIVKAWYGGRLNRLKRFVCSYHYGDNFRPFDHMRIPEVLEQHPNPPEFVPPMQFRRVIRRPNDRKYALLGFRFREKEFWFCPWWELKYIDDSSESSQYEGNAAEEPENPESTDEDNDEEIGRHYQQNLFY